ncbi:hypothetical protein ACQPYK_16465 [Streptosporangium sp. CA-135522]|uniref:hypothetical protein n=1 Tax=Streptosporangium sp. CA-135522 TaxID=3240072 RepID=UPI003D8DC653
MSRSLKIARILLVAVFVAGLSACSGQDGSSSSPSAAASPSPAESESAAASPSPAESETGSAEDATETPGDGATDTGPAVDLIGSLSVTLTQPGWITVQLDGGDAQPVMLRPDAVVLDVQGAICDKGAIPHKCTAAQLEKALKAGKDVYAKVTLKSGTATRVEEIVRQ